MKQGQSYSLATTRQAMRFAGPKWFFRKNCLGLFYRDHAAGAGGEIFD
jgi:hypothetical protein